MIKDSYAETHRKHMSYEIARQNNQWRRLNERRKGLPRQIWENHSESIGLLLYCFAGIMVTVLAILVVFL